LNYSKNGFYSNPVVDSWFLDSLEKQALNAVNLVMSKQPGCTFEIFYASFKNVFQDWKAVSPANLEKYWKQNFGQGQKPVGDFTPLRPQKAAKKKASSPKANLRMGKEAIRAYVDSEEEKKKVIDTDDYYWDSLHLWNLDKTLEASKADTYKIGDVFPTSDEKLQKIAGYGVSVLETLLAARFKEGTDLKAIAYLSLADLIVEGQLRKEEAEGRLNAAFKNQAEALKEIQVAEDRIRLTEYGQDLKEKCQAEDEWIIILSNVCFLRRVETLLAYPNKAIFALFAYDFKGLISLLNRISGYVPPALEKAEDRASEDGSGDLKEPLSETISSLMDLIPPVRRELIYQRHPELCGESKTLEELGSLFGLTRERVRQIDKKILADLNKSAGDFSPLADAMIMKHEKDFVFGLLPLSKLAKEFKDQEEEKNFLFLLNSMQSFSDSYRFSVDEKVIYLGKDSEEETFAQIFRDLPLTLSLAEFAEFPEEIKRFALKRYNILGNYYVKKERSILSTLALNTLKEVFPAGFSTGGDDADLQKLKKALHAKFGSAYDDLTREDILSYIERSQAFMGIDKSRYKDKNLCASLDEELLAKIKDFISKFSGSVYYQVIYNKFQPELSVLGIGNWFYFKSVFDSQTAGEFHTKRDYIKLEENMTARETILAKIRSFSGPFGLDDLHKSFIGLPDYIFTLLIYENRDWILSINDKRYICKDRIGFSSQDAAFLASFISASIKQAGTIYITARKVLAGLKESHPEFLSKFSLLNNSFNLFSVAKAFCPDFFYQRPIISIDKGFAGEKEAFIDFISKSNSLTKEYLIQAQTRLGFHLQYDFQEFAEELSGDFVQVDENSLVKKEKMGLEEYQLDDIKRELESLINKKGKLDTASFADYSLFPDIGYKWNQYLLSGLVRTFYPENFDLVDVQDNGALSFEISASRQL
jgi:hypothetical protein